MAAFFRDRIFLSLFSFCEIADALKCPEDACYKCECFYTADGACGATLTDWACDKCCDGNPRECTQSTGAPWQLADTGAGSHHCTASCLSLPANLPKNPLWYDDPTKNNDPAANVGNTNDTLPIVLDWEQSAWKDGGKYNDDGSPKSMATSNYGANSFYIEIDNPDDQLLDPGKVANATYSAATKIFGKCLDHDYFNSRDDGAPCFFRAGKKNITYRVKACCAANCTDCAPFVPFSFSTGEFAEPKSPLDPDWNGPSAATGLAFKGLQLEWCKSWVTNVTPVDWAKSYELMVTSDETRHWPARLPPAPRYQQPMHCH